MRTEEQIKFHQSWGFNIRKIDGIHFLRQGLKLSSFPLEEKININQKLVRKLKWKSLVSSVLINAPRKDMYEYILDTSSYDLTLFAKKTRYNINKCLKNCTLERPSLPVLIEEGLRLNVVSLERQHKKDSLLTKRKRWIKYMTSVYNSNEFKILGAFFEGRMVGILIVYEAEGKFNIIKAFIDRKDATRTQPMSGLLYTMISGLIQEHGAIRISYGMHQFSGRSSLNDFKRRMRFEPLPGTRGFILNPLVSIPLKLMVFYLFKIRKMHHASRTWEKEIIRIFQGYRQVKALLKQEKSFTGLPQQKDIQNKNKFHKEEIRRSA